MTDEPPQSYRSGILHGRRQGRRLRETQSSLMTRLLPAFALGRNQSLDDVSALFPVPVTELRLEIGFGGGEHLAAQAGQNPEVGFIGCEPFRNGVARMLQHLEATPRGNVRLYAGDAGDVIDRLPPACLSRVDLLYPDPWPKRRQRKRRFVSEAMLKRLARAMRPGAEFRFATDIDDYAGWTLSRIAGSADFIWPAITAEQWRVPWASWVPTRYEAKAKREGRPPVYLTFERR